MQLINQKVLLTGGSNGVGFALAKELVRRGNSVLITGRNPDRLAVAADELDGDVLTFAADQADHEALKRLVAFVKEKWNALSVLVNNAAIQYNYRLNEKPVGEMLTDVAYETQVNFTSVVQLTGLCLPLLVPSGAIVNITSGLALTPKRSAPIYCATKAALHSFSQSLRCQLGDSPQHKDVAVIEALLPMVATPMTAGRGRGKIAPEQAAAAILKGIERRQNEVNIGKVKLLRFLLRAAPSVASKLLRNS